MPPAGRHDGLFFGREQEAPVVHFRCTNGINLFLGKKRLLLSGAPDRQGQINQALSLLFCMLPAIRASHTGSAWFFCISGKLSLPVQFPDR